MTIVVSAQRSNDGGNALDGSNLFGFHLEGNGRRQSIFQ